MEIIQEIGSYAGFAAVLGLAVLSALYFSQARDVKRLREWAGRAPDRAPTPAIPEPRGVVAQPIARPASRPIPGGTPPPVPRPPGAQPATPGAAAAASAAGAAPAIARGPAPATPAAAGAGAAGEGLDDDREPVGDGEQDITAMDTVVHPPPSPLEGDDEADGDGEDGGVGAEGEADEGFDDAPEDGGPDEQHTGDEEALGDEGEPAGAETGDYDPAALDETAVHRAGDTGEADAVEDDPGTGEWRPEDEHSDIDFTDEHDVVPATPAASAPRPPVPPRPYQRRGAPAPATGYARDRGAILPPYEESRPDSETGEPSSGAGRRPILLVVAAMVAIAVVAFGVLQLTGGDDSSDGGSDAGLATGGGSGGSDASGDGGSSAPPIDPSQVTVAVLNGTTVPGLAATIGDKVVGEGFQLGTVTNNFDQEKAESVVLYAPGAEREAADVSRRLDISQREPIDAESQALAGDATVVVVAGADQNQ